MGNARDPVGAGFVAVCQLRIFSGKGLGGFGDIGERLLKDTSGGQGDSLLPSQLCETLCQQLYFFVEEGTEDGGEQ